MLLLLLILVNETTGTVLVLVGYISLEAALAMTLMYVF